MGPILVLLLSIGVGVVVGEISYVDIFTYDDNNTIPDLSFVCQYVNNSDQVSKSCADQLAEVCLNTTLLSTMLDASSKFPYAGLGYSTRKDFGNFDECMTIKHEYEHGKILGEHCTIGLVIPDFVVNASDQDLMYTLAICRPNGCNANDLNAIVTNSTNISLPLFQDMYCQTIESHTEFTASDIVTTSIISVCVLLMIISSVYDFYLSKTGLECSNQLYLAFSVITNGKKLLRVTKQSKEQIHTFHGLKVISMMWIIAGHGFATWQGIGIVNVPEIEQWQSKISSAYIYAARLAVDTFFFISGFLLAYQFLKRQPRPFKAHLKDIPILYLHRYIRLTPAVAMVYLVAISILKHFGSGPLWSAIIDVSALPCRKYWWSFFLYIQNYYNYNDQDLCLVVTWYLSADMQMFLLSPLIIISVAMLLKKSIGFKLTMIQMFSLNIIFIALPMLTKLVFPNYLNQYDTHSRLIDYFMGATLGIFMRVKQEKPFLYMINSRRKSAINLIVWAIALFGMVVIVVCQREVELYEGHTTQSIFESLMRPAWCIGLSWVIYSCQHGYGGIVNWILCRPIFQIWGRLTYCMYLLHVVVILTYIGSLRTRLYFTEYYVFYMFCGHLVVTFILSVLWTLAFEAPLLTIEKVIFGGESNKKQVKSQHNGHSEEGIKEIR